MKKIIVVLLLCLFPLWNSCSSSSLLGGGYPDLTKAFPSNRLLNNIQHGPKRKSYLYLTMKNFETNKAEFEKFLGSNWAVVPGNEGSNQELQAILDKNKKNAHKLKVTGSAYYLSPKYQNKSILLIHTKGDSLLSSVYLLEDTL